MAGNFPAVEKGIYFRFKKFNKFKAELKINKKAHMGPSKSHCWKLKIKRKS